MTKKPRGLELLGFHLFIDNKEMNWIIQPFLANELQTSA